MFGTRFTVQHFGVGCPSTFIFQASSRAGISELQYIFQFLGKEPDHIVGKYSTASNYQYIALCECQLNGTLCWDLGVRGRLTVYACKRTVRLIIRLLNLFTNCVVE
jgi:hypothetical protein